jgi:serine protease inhibitor
MRLPVYLCIAFAFVIFQPMTIDATAIRPHSDPDLEMGLSLFKQIYNTSKDRNVVVSPSSAYMALAMVTGGAEGNTEKQLLKFLGDKGSIDNLNQEVGEIRFKSKSNSEKVTLETANAIFVNKTAPVLSSFIGETKKLFDAEISSENFADKNTIGKINNWCSLHTHDKINSIITNLDPSDLMVLINALYFKGKWNSPFEVSATEPSPFTLLNGSTKTVSMMHQVDHYSYMTGSGFSSVTLPYVGHDLAMLVFLPDKGTTLDSFISSLSLKNWQSWMGSYTNNKVNLGLPKFKTEYSRELNSDLKNLGVQDAFSSNANFSKMFPPATKAFISLVIQKTYIDVKEEGTEAAAVTAVNMSMGMAVDPTPVKTFTVDHPFVFAIVNRKTGQLLFIGSMVNPSAK